MNRDSFNAIDRYMLDAILIDCDYCLGRIDNQFCSKEFIPIESRVIREIKNSDHFPVFAKYVFKKGKQSDFESLTTRSNSVP